MISSVVRMLRRLLAQAARPYLRTFGLLQTAKIYNRSALVYEPTGGRVLVLAPHMDDEVIGCGGTLARHLACGAEVTVLFLTNGALGGVVSGSVTGDPGQNIAATRKEEARRALGALGVERIRYLDADDGRLMAQAPALASKLRDLLEEIRPAIVYLPFFLEEHPDHRAASQLLLEAVQGTNLRFECFGYEVWTPLFPNCLVRIDETVEMKKRALTEYQSQLAESDYLHTALGINAYRSSAFLGGTCRFAEAFCALPVSDYLSLYRAYRRGDDVRST